MLNQALFNLLKQVSITILVLFAIYKWESNSHLLLEGTLPYVIVVFVILATILLSSQNYWYDFCNRKSLDLSIRMLVIESFIVLDNLRYATACLNHSRLALAMAETNTVFSETLSRFSSESKEWSSSSVEGMNTWVPKTTPVKMYDPWMFFRKFNYFESYYIPTRQVYTMDDFTRTYTQGEMISKFYRTIELVNGRSTEERYACALIQFDAYRKVFLKRYNMDLKAKKCYGFANVETSDLLNQMVPWYDCMRNQNMESKDSIRRQVRENRERLNPELEDTSPSASYYKRLREIRKDQSVKLKYCGVLTRENSKYL